MFGELKESIATPLRDSHASHLLLEGGGAVRLNKRLRACLLRQQELWRSSLVEFVIINGRTSLHVQLIICELIKPAACLR